MNSRDTEEISDTAFIIALLLWTLWQVDFGVHMFQWGKHGDNNTAQASQKVCSNEWLALKEIEKISYDLDPEIILESDNRCSLIFSVSENSISFVHYLNSPQLMVNTYFFDQVIADSLINIDEMQHVHVKRNFGGDFKNHFYISDQLMILDSISAGQGLRIYVENVLLSLGASIEKKQTNI